MREISTRIRGRRCRRWRGRGAARTPGARVDLAAVPPDLRENTEVVRTPERERWIAQPIEVGEEPIPLGALTLVRPEEREPEAMQRSLIVSQRAAVDLDDAGSRGRPARRQRFGTGPGVSPSAQVTGPSDEPRRLAEIGQKALCRDMDVDRPLG
jgi:hypothetical protein